MYGDKLSIDIANMIYEVAANIVEEYQPLKDFEGFTLECIKNFGIESPFEAQQFNNGKEEDITQQLFEAAQKHYLEKSHAIAEQAFPVVRDVYKNPNNTFENIVTPFTDGIKGVQVIEINNDDPEQLIAGAQIIEKAVMAMLLGINRPAKPAGDALSCSQ